LRKIATLFTVAFLGFFTLSLSEELSLERQQDIIERYQYIRGQLSLPPASMEEYRGDRCGTSIALEFFINRDNFTGEYAKIAAVLAARPAVPLSIISPDSLFRIHYAISGADSVYQKDNVVLYDGQSVPLYAYKVAQIADSVWDFEVNHLGFLRPPPDDTAGGDSLIDIYIINMPPQYYGETNGETPLTTQRATSFIEIDNDYGSIYPYNQSPNINRRLDAARVTVAHEFFHTIHYGLDYTEYETHLFQDPSNVQPWWEMTATWMEDMVFDNINDYYGYLSAFYDHPWLALQNASPAHILHQYASAIFPIFLTEKFDTLIIRDIWERCRDLGVGPQWAAAADQAIIEFSDSTYDLRRAFQEFAVWNYFTGSRYNLAPPGYKFSEGQDYPEIPSQAILSFNQYSTNLIHPNWPDTLSDGTSVIPFKTNLPQNMSAHYLYLRNIPLITDSLLRTVFGGVRDADYGTKWGFSFITFPSGPGYPTVDLIQQSPVVGSNVAYNIPTDGVQSVIAIPTPVSNNLLSYSASAKKWGYSVYFFSANIDTLKDEFEFLSPYPNPIVTPTDDDYVTFRLKVKTGRFNGIAGRMDVTIFSTTGEKLNKISSATDKTGFYQYYFGDIVKAQWSLDNQERRKISPGVYLAYCEMVFADGRSPITEKYKVAVIK
jgi:hypothetical protein